MQFQMKKTQYFFSFALSPFFPLLLPICRACALKTALRSCMGTENFFYWKVSLGLFFFFLRRQEDYRGIICHNIVFFGEGTLLTHVV